MDHDWSPDASHVLDIVRGIVRAGNLGEEHAINRIPQLVDNIDSRRASAERQIERLREKNAEVEAVSKAVGRDYSDLMRLNAKLDKEATRDRLACEQSERTQAIQHEEIRRLRTALLEAERQRDVANQKVIQLDRMLRENTDPQHWDRIHILTQQGQRLRARLGTVLRKLRNAQETAIILETIIPDSEYCIACWGTLHSLDCPIARVRAAFGERQEPVEDVEYPDDHYDPDYDEDEPLDAEEEDDGTWGNGDDGY